MKNITTVFITSIIFVTSNAIANSNNTHFLSKRPHQELVKEKNSVRENQSQHNKEQQLKQEQRLNLHFISKRPYMQKQPN